MNDKALTDIKDFAVDRLNSAYGFCGAMDSENIIVINSSDDDSREIIIKITKEKADG